MCRDVRVDPGLQQDATAAATRTGGGAAPRATRATTADEQDVEERGSAAPWLKRKLPPLVKLCTR